MNAHTNSIRHAVFLNNSRIVSVSDDLTMRVWDRTSGQVIHYFLNYFNLCLGLTISFNYKSPFNVVIVNCIFGEMFLAYNN